MKGLRRFPLATLTVAGLALGGMASMEGVAYADGGWDIVVQQNFSTTDDTVSDEFEYCFEAQTPNAPMPAGTKGDSYCFTIKGTKNVTLTLHADQYSPAKSEYVLRLATRLPKGYTLTKPVGGDRYYYEVYNRPGDSDVPSGYIVIVRDGKRMKDEDPTFDLRYGSTSIPPTSTPPTPTPPGETPTTPPSSTTPPGETPTKEPPSDDPSNPVKPPISTLVRTGATISLGAMLVLLLVGGLFLLARRESR